MSKILDQAWHATRRGPSTYDDGLDALGAGIGLPRSGGASPDPAKVTAAGQRAVAAAAKLAASRPKTAAKLASIGQRTLQRAQSAKALTARAVKTAAVKAAVAAQAKRAPLAVSPRGGVTRSGRVPVRTPSARLLGDAVQQHLDPSAGGQMTAVALSPAAIRLLIDSMNQANAAAQAGEIENAIITAGNTIPAGRDDLVQSGQALVDRCDQVITNVSSDQGDPTAVATVAQIATDATAWQAQLQAVLSGTAQPPAAAPGSFDPGSAGGGGGSDGGGAGGGAADDGGGDDGGESAEPMASSDPNVQRFRQSGGDWDPFADADEGDAQDGSDLPGAASTADGSDADPFAVADDGSGTGDESVMGLTSSDYHFEAADLINPAGAYTRTQEAAEARDRAVVADFQAGTPKALAQQASPQVAARLKAAMKRLDAAKRREAALRAQHQGLVAQAAQLDPQEAGATDDQGSTIMGMDEMAEICIGLGFDAEEMQDILIDTWQHEITDAEPDPQRMSASAHRGSAYLQNYHYPPGGASAGQEGGDVMPVETIEVFGRHDYGCDVLGARIASRAKAPPAPRAGFVKKTTPGGRVYTSLVVNKPKHDDDKASIRNAKEAGQRAVAMGQKLAKVLATHVRGAAISSKRKAPAASKGRFAHMSLGQLKRIAAQALKAGKGALEQSGKHEKFVGAHQAHVAAGVKAVKTTYGPSGRKGTVIHGDFADEIDTDVEVLGAYADVLGDDAADQTTDPSLDPNTDPTATDPSVSPDGTPYGLGPAPTVPPPLQPGVDFAPASSVPNNDQVFFSGLPLGAVVYQKQQPLPWKGVASYSRYYGKFPGSEPDGGDNSGLQWGGGDKGIMDGWYVWWANAYHDGAAVDLRYKHEGNDQVPMYANNQERSADSQRHGWGPLIGDPNGGWTAGLRYDTAGDQWFWFRDQAPGWATADDDLKRLNQAILDYKAQVAAVAADAAAQAAQDKLDADAAKQQAKQQAKEDADTARRQQQEQKQAEADAAKQAVADQTAAQQQSLADESAARQYASQADQDRQDALTQAQIDKQAADYEAALEQKAIETEARLDAMQQGRGGDPGDGGGDDGSADATQDGDGGSMPDDVDAMSDEEVMGLITDPSLFRGVDRVRLRRALRRG